MVGQDCRRLALWADVELLRTDAAARPRRRPGVQEWCRLGASWVYLIFARAFREIRGSVAPADGGRQEKLRLPFPSKRSPLIESSMGGRECYHCKQWIENGATHDCWTTTEAALTGDLPEDLREAWERLRETAVSFGPQRIYASHSSIMFSRTSCYFFVRPKKNFLEVCVFLGRRLKARHVRRVDRASKSKFVHIIQIRHRDEVESPVTDWLQEAYDLSDVLASRTGTLRAKSKPKSRLKPRP
jgi:uncharacterized protein DUF5655